MPSKVQLIGGAFQDSEGNLLANGYLVFRLSQDASVVGVGSICAGREVTVALNASGSVSTSPAQQFIWANDQMSPANTFYRVTGYTAQGQPAWGPNNQQVLGNGGTFDVGTWIPNQVFSWQPAVQAPLLETNGAQNTLQTLLNLISGANITLAADSFGGVTISETLTPVMDIACFSPGALTNSQILLHFEIRHNCTFPTNLSGSKCVALTAATASTTLTIKHNGSSVGTMVFGIAGTVATLTLTTFNAVVGDTLEVVGPNPADSTLASVAFTMVATRTS